MWQHIVYNEYLPVVLGPMYCRIYDLVLHRVGYFKGKKGYLLIFVNFFGLLNLCLFLMHVTQV